MATAQEIERTRKRSRELLLPRSEPERRAFYQKLIGEVADRTDSRAACSGLAAEPDGIGVLSR